mmetsp:Transcript_1572/g.2556  ORF Transcript_1572/g.2556 Transcript_1572/m.2556 type:complete len:92 (+) Transcript_1572:67-342(+)
MGGRDVSEAVMSQISGKAVMSQISGNFSLCAGRIMTGSGAHTSSVPIHGAVCTPGRKDQRSKEFAAAKKGKLSFFGGGDSETSVSINVCVS